MKKSNESEPMAPVVLSENNCPKNRITKWLKFRIVEMSETNFSCWDHTTTRHLSRKCFVSNFEDGLRDYIKNKPAIRTSTQRESGERGHSHHPISPLSTSLNLLPLRFARTQLTFFITFISFLVLPSFGFIYIFLFCN